MATRPEHMNINKAVITAAARNQRHLLLQTVVDRNGTSKSTLQVIAEEAVSAGIEAIAVVICPGDEEDYARAAGSLSGQLTFVPQEEPRGYGHALWSARDFTAEEPFLHFVGDHLYVSRDARSSTQILLETAARESCSVSAVQATRETMLPYYGTIGGHRLAQRKHLYAVERVIEKPTPTDAEQHLIVPGLRAGHYLCFFGIHVLTPGVMALLDEEVARAGPEEKIQLSSILDRLSSQEKYLALELPGRRYNIGVKYGLFMAQLALALEGQDREELLAQMLEILALRNTHSS